MSAFVLREQGLVLNRHAANAKKIPISSWDLGSNEDSSFLSAKPDPALGLPSGRLLNENLHGTCSHTCMPVKSLSKLFIPFSEIALTARLSL